MKRNLLAFCGVVLLSISIAQAQYFSRFYNDNQNPNGLNKDGENPFPSTANTGWTTLWSGGTGPTAYSAVQNIPFPFEFNGVAVSNYVAGNFGTVTFSSTVPAIKPDNFGNLTLPNANIPDNSVCILGGTPKSVVSGTQTFTSAVMSKTYGTAPNRQHWIWFNFFGEANIQNGWTYWAIVLEEGTNDIYIVDMKTLCVTPNGQLCTNNIKMSAGIQVTSNPSEVYTVAGSPNLGANQITQNLFTAEDNSYYRFSAGIAPSNSARTVNVIANEFNILSQGPFTIKATIQNHGSASLNNVEAAYQINGGNWIEATINTAGIATNSYREITHTSTWAPTTPGSYTINFRVKNPNGQVDPIDNDDMATLIVQVVDTFVNRRSLLEVFSSSTCGPCNPGNTNLKNITDQMPENNYAYIKYQFPFPGTGDPYTTTEGRDRGTYYDGVNSIPTTLVDGANRMNPNSANTPMITGIQSKPAFVVLSANAFISWKDNINYSVQVNPFVDIPAGTRLHVALVEKSTVNNVKSNGETIFYNVFKKFAHGSAGFSLPVIAKGESQNVNGNIQVQGIYRLPPNGQQNIINWNTEHSIENFHNLALVVFLQNNTTKEVLQSVVTDVSMNTNVNEIETTNNFFVYPNPASDILNISVSNNNKTDVTVTNIQGSVIFTTQLNNTNTTNEVAINTTNFSNGVYIVTLTQNGVKNTQKVIITR
jgi:hypothetical protein